MISSAPKEDNIVYFNYMFCYSYVFSIERFWREIWHGCTGAYYHLFCTMEEELILNVDNELDLLALHMVFLERMKQSLKRFCTAVAHRPLRTEGNKTPLQLWILGQGLNPREELSQEVYFLNVKIKIK